MMLFTKKESMTTPRLEPKQSNWGVIMFIDYGL